MLKAFFAGSSGVRVEVCHGMAAAKTARKTVPFVTRVEGFTSIVTTFLFIDVAQELLVVCFS